MPPIQGNGKKEQEIGGDAMEPRLTIGGKANKKRLSGLLKRFMKGKA